MRNLITQVATDRPRGFFNQGGRGQVRFNDSQRRPPPRAGQEQREAPSRYPRREDYRQRRRPSTGDVEGAMMYLRDLVTSDFATRNREERVAPPTNDPSQPKATPIMLTPSGIHEKEIDNEETSGSYRDAWQTFADEEKARSSGDSNSSGKY